jgi:methionyl-tRNA synthetase
MSKQPFYITTTLPYTNADPHIGFAKEIINADVIARWQTLQGKEVFFNTGTDEHGLKIYQLAAAAGLTARAFCDPYAAKFQQLIKDLQISATDFIRTTDDKHVAAAQEIWKRCDAKGDIYKKSYHLKYCVGCELEKTESELVNGRCPLHPNRELEVIDEENYFFRFSKYAEPLLKYYDAHPNFVQPAHRFTEIRNFVAAGLQDFSISRLKSKMPNGVPIPGDDEQVMYVWFDALVSYISTLDWPQDQAKFHKFWPGLQVCGKDNLRQQTAMWQAMLMSADLPNSLQVLVFGFLTVDGQKISKSIGNGINPKDIIDKFGIDALRYYLLSEIATFEDGDFSEEKLRLKYNADLANGLGNLAARVSTLLEKNNLATNLAVTAEQAAWYQNFKTHLEAYSFNDALAVLWGIIKTCDEKLTVAAPWKLTDQTEIAAVLVPIAQDILNIAYCLQPLLPQTAQNLLDQYLSGQIKKGGALFPRLEA